jgi:hypothetical protein
MEQEGKSEGAQSKSKGVRTQERGSEKAPLVSRCSRRMKERQLEHRPKREPSS